MRVKTAVDSVKRWAGRTSRIGIGGVFSELGLRREDYRGAILGEPLVMELDYANSVAYNRGLFGRPNLIRGRTSL